MEFTYCRNYEYWVIYLACKHQMSNDQNNFENFSACGGTVQAGDIETIRSCSTENVQTVSFVICETWKVTFHDVFWVQNIMYNLNAVSRIPRNNCPFIFENTGGESQREILTIENMYSHPVKRMAHGCNKGLYGALLTVRHNEEASKTRYDETNIWRKCLGHCMMKY